MKLEFLGTRGYIETKSRRHQKHSSTMINYLDKALLIDCGEDWLGEVEVLNPDAILVTHAHPDHVGGLKDGAPCPVFAMPESWEEMDGYDIHDRRVLGVREPYFIYGVDVEAFLVDHSTVAPAVGYRITAGEVVIFYAPDVVYIHGRDEAMKDAKLYVGDGATVSRSLVRKHDDTIVGHTSIRRQLTWCKKENVPLAVFTHCGTEIVNGDERKIGPEVRRMAEERGVEAQIAYDGLEIVLR